MRDELGKKRTVVFNSMCMCRREWRIGIQDRSRWSERERGGGFRQNILVGGKEEESSGEEKSKGWILLPPVFSCSLFLLFGINVLLRIQQHTDDSSRLSYRTFYLSSSILSGTCNLAHELETLSLVCKLQSHPGLSLLENLLQEKHTELSLHGGQEKESEHWYAEQRDAGQPEQYPDMAGSIVTKYLIYCDNMTRFWFKIFVIAYLPRYSMRKPLLE